MVFDRKEYMKNYYKKNSTKLKQYSSDYKKKDKQSIPMEVKRGSFTIVFN